MTQPLAHQWLNTDGLTVELAVTTPAGDILRLPLQAAADHGRMSQLCAMYGDAQPAPELLRWTWTEQPTCGDEECVSNDCEACTSPPVRRAARLLVETLPLTVPVRRQLPDGSFGTVEITPEEWAATEGRRVRGQ